MIIGVCGFGSSGSSAVTDYLKEFNTTEVLDNIEFQILTYPDGIESLDYYLNENISKYASSDVAITRFSNLMKRLSSSYDRLTNGRFTILTNEYIDNIVQASWLGYGSTDYSINPTKFYRFVGGSIMKGRVIPLLEKVFSRQINCYPVREIPFSVKPDNFLETTKQYIDDVLIAMGKTNKITVLNQPFAGNDPKKTFKYFDDPKAIVVDRDPRDMYAFTKKFLLSAGRSIPSDDVKSFVIYYRNLREGMPYKTDPDILKIQFEDLVYNYEETAKTINAFCGLDYNDRNKTIFIPEQSINNTRVYLRYPDLEEDIKYIEKELAEYLFPFEQFTNEMPTGQMFYGRSKNNDGGK